MEKINIEKLGEIVTDNPPYSLRSQDLHLAVKELAEKINEIVDWINVKMGLDNIERELKDKSPLKK